MWYVGQKIVCKDNDWLVPAPDIYPVIGQVYTIKVIGDNSDEVSFVLEEIPLFQLAKNNRMCFFSWRERHFRPIQLSGMETLRSLLKPVKENA